jgi:hypothetical protein
MGEVLVSLVEEAESDAVVHACAICAFRGRGAGSASVLGGGDGILGEVIVIVTEHDSLNRETAFCQYQLWCLGLRSGEEVSEREICGRGDRRHPALV